MGRGGWDQRWYLIVPTNDRSGDQLIPRTIQTEFSAKIDWRRDLDPTERLRMYTPIPLPGRCPCNAPPGAPVAVEPRRQDRREVPCGMLPGGGSYGRSQVGSINLAAHHHAGCLVFMERPGSLSPCVRKTTGKDGKGKLTASAPKAMTYHIRGKRLCSLRNGTTSSASHTTSRGISSVRLVR